MSFGRPTLYDAKYCQMLIDHMATGLSYEAFAGLIGVSKQTLYDWEKVNPDFLDAKGIGLERGRIFWETLGVKHIVNISSSEGGKGGSSTTVALNSTVWVFNMKNRFGWRDKQDIEHSNPDGKMGSTSNVKIYLPEKEKKDESE